MPLLIDGHNLIGQLPDVSLSDPNDEAKLIRRLQSYALLARKQITVVFDPNPGDTRAQLYPEVQQHGAVKVIYAMPGQKADDVLRGLIAQVHDRQGMLLVTSDNAVAKYGRVCGLKVQGSAEFGNAMKALLAERIFADAKPAPTRKEVSDWSEIFKEPEPEPQKPQAKPAAGPKQPSPAELKKQRRMEQLRKQTKGVRSLGTNTTKTTSFEHDE